MDGEEYTSEADESVNVSRLITEEDLIDSLFYTCDVDDTGKVPVSRLIEYLKFTAGQSTFQVRYIRAVSFWGRMCVLEHFSNLTSCLIDDWARRYIGHDFDNDSI